MNDKKCIVEVFARVTGFFRPVQTWNEGKTAEFNDRKKYRIDAVNDEMQDENSRAAEAVAG